MMIDYLHTENTDGHGYPQADFKGERELSRITRKLSINIGAHQAKASDEGSDEW